MHDLQLAPSQSAVATATEHQIDVAVVRTASLPPLTKCEQRTLTRHHRRRYAKGVIAIFAAQKDIRFSKFARWPGDGVRWIAVRLQPTIDRGHCLIVGFLLIREVTVWALAGDQFTVIASSAHLLVEQLGPSVGRDGVTIAVHATQRFLRDAAPLRIRS